MNQSSKSHINLLNNVYLMDHLHDRGQRLFLAFSVAMATKISLNNANGRSNHHAKFEIFLSYY